MKIARFSSQDTLRFGIVDGEELVALSGDPLFAGYDTTGERVAATDATLLAPVIPRSKVVGFEDLGADEQILFVKPNTTVIGGQDVIVRPRAAEETDYAPALAVVIGRVAKNVSAADALTHVFGYAIAADITARDLYETDAIPDRAKGFDTFCPLGPVIETEAPDAHTLTVRKNGAVASSVELGPLVAQVPAAVEYASAVFTLLPGDVLLVPADVDPIRFEAGDTFEADAVALGVLRSATRDA